MTYQPGPTNAADALSRLRNTQNKVAKRNAAEEYAYFIAKTATPNALKLEDIDRESSTDEEIIAVRKAIKSGIWNECNKAYKVIKTELSEYSNCRKTRNRKQVIYNID